MEGGLKGSEYSKGDFGAKRSQVGDAGGESKAMIRMEACGDHVTISPSPLKF